MKNKVISLLLVTLLIIGMFPVHSSALDNALSYGDLWPDFGDSTTEGFTYHNRSSDGQYATAVSDLILPKRYGAIEIPKTTIVDGITVHMQIDNPSANIQFFGIVGDHSDVTNAAVNDISDSSNFVALSGTEFSAGEEAYYRFSNADIINISSKADENGVMYLLFRVSSDPNENGGAVGYNAYYTQGMTDTKLTSKESHYTINQTNKTIEADQTSLTTDTTIYDFIGNLNIPEYFNSIILWGNYTPENLADFSSEEALASEVAKVDNGYMNVGDVIGVIAEDGSTYAIYTVTVTEASWTPLSSNDYYINEEYDDFDEMWYRNIDSDAVDITEGITTVSEFLNHLSFDAVGLDENNQPLVKVVSESNGIDLRDSINNGTFTWNDFVDYNSIKGSTDTMSDGDYLIVFNTLKTKAKMFYVNTSNWYPFESDYDDYDDDGVYYLEGDDAYIFEGLTTVSDILGNIEFDAETVKSYSAGNYAKIMTAQELTNLKVGGLTWSEFAGFTSTKTASSVITDGDQLVLFALNGTNYLNYHIITSQSNQPLGIHAEYGIYYGDSIELVENYGDAIEFRQSDAAVIKIPLSELENAVSLKFSFYNTSYHNTRVMPVSFITFSEDEGAELDSFELSGLEATDGASIGIYTVTGEDLSDIMNLESDDDFVYVKIMSDEDNWSEIQNATYIVTEAETPEEPSNNNNNNTPAPTPIVTIPTNTTVVTVNGKVENAGTETSSTESGRSVVTVEVNNKTIEATIKEVAKTNPTGAGNTIQISITDSKSDVAKVMLTGDIIKQLETNTFNLSVKRNDVEYLIPAKELTVSNIAKELGVSEESLSEISFEVRMTKLDATIIAQYEAVAKSNGAQLVFPPMEFEIIANTTKADNTKASVAIDKFSDYVERVMEIPEGIDPSQITTGIVFNADGSYSHVPTNVFQKDGKWYAQLNSLTNSNYSVIWNQVTVASVNNHWAKDAVNDMASRLVILNPEKFDPNQAITRADFTEYLIRALGLYRENTPLLNRFSDVVLLEEETSILIADAYNIISGYSDGTFKPEQMITREEAMAMISRAMKVIKLVGSDDYKYQNYVDYDEVGNWASESVVEVLSAHIFNGKSADLLSPKSNMTYAEAAQAIRNMLVESELINE